MPTYQQTYITAGGLPVVGLMVSARPVFTDDPTVVDGRIVTGRLIVATTDQTGAVSIGPLLDGPGYDVDDGTGWWPWWRDGAEQPYGGSRRCAAL